MKRYRLKAILKRVLTLCLVLIILPIPSVSQSAVEVTLQQTSSLASEDILSSSSAPSGFSGSSTLESESLYPEDFDLMQYLNDNPNEYQKVWEPWLTKAAVHAIATSKDGDFLAVGGGYLYDNEVHIYRWNLKTREYDKVWDSGDGIIKGDVLSLAFGDTDNNKFMDIAVGSADGHIYVFEQRHIYDPFTRTENQFEHVWTSPKMRPVFSVAIEDTDKDGVLDILAGSWDGKVRAYEYRKHSGYPFSKEHWIQYEEVWNSGDFIKDKVTAITTADTNYNGLPEIIAGTRNGSIYVFENDGAVLYVEGVPFPLTNDNKYVNKTTISGYVWKPILSLDSGDLDEDFDDEVVALAAGQGVYVLDYTASGYRLNKLTRPLESWELGAGPLAGHPLDYYVDDILSATNVSNREAMAGPPDDYCSVFQPNATAVLDFGRNEEATGNGNDIPDLIVKFASEPELRDLSFSVSQDLKVFAEIETKDLHCPEYDVYINLDMVLAERRWDYVRYLKITVYEYGMEHNVDSIKAETLYRPLSTATAATIRTLNLDSKQSISEFTDRIEAYSSGVDYEEVAEEHGRRKEPNRLILGTADGRLLVFGYNTTSKAYDQIWDSYLDERFNLKTNIWAIEEVKTLGKIPTWMLNYTKLDVPLSFKIDYPFKNYASMTFADVNLDGSLDMIIGTKQGTLKSPTAPSIERDFTDVNTTYTGKWVSAAFGQLRALYPAKVDHLELVVGWLAYNGGIHGGIDYWDYDHFECLYKKGWRISLDSMESTGYLRQALSLSLTLPKAALADMDGDSDIDITVTNGRIYYLENIGNITDPSFEMKPDYYSSINLYSPDKVFSGPQLVDFDLDGDLDLVVGFANKPGATYYENTGTAQNPVWVEARRLFSNSKYNFRNDKFTDPAFYDVSGLYDILKARVEELPAREVFVKAYVDTFGTRYVMSAYNNATNENDIVAFVGDTESHSRFVVGTNPRVARLEVALANGPLRNYGYQVLETWNNDPDLDEWTMTVTSGDVDGDGRNEVIVGDFDNNMYVFEHLTNNTYKRAFRSFDINHTVMSEKSPYAWEELEGLSGKFYRTIWDHVEHLIADTDLDNDKRKEVIAAADLSIFVFEWTGVDDQYELIWREDLRKSTWGPDLKAKGIEKISALSYHKDLDNNGYGEIIVGADSFLFIYESRPSNTFVEWHQTTIDGLVGYWNFDEGSGDTAYDRSGHSNTGILYGPSWVDRKYGKALSFDGVDDFVSTPFIPLYDRSFTVETWVNAKNLPTDPIGAPILLQWDSHSTDKYLHIVIRNSLAYFGFYNDDLRGNTVISPNTWYHIAFVYDSVSNKKFIYVNGVLDASGASLSPYKGSSGNTTIGGALKENKFFNGTIDEVKIYDRALTAEEIAAVAGRLFFPSMTIQTIATGDTDSDGYNDIVVGGASGQNGFISILENQGGTYVNVWSLPPTSKWMIGSRVNTIVIDDQDYDGRKELIVGHEHGINIWEHTGTDNQYDVREAIASSPTYPKPELFTSLSWTSTEIPSFRRNSDILQLSNGTLIQVYSKESGVTIYMGEYFPAIDEVLLFFRTSNDNGTTWTPEKRLTNSTDYTSLPDYDPDYIIVSEIEPSITESGDGEIWFTWATVTRKLVEVWAGGYYLYSYPWFRMTILAKYFRTSWSTLLTVVPSYETAFFYPPPVSPCIWEYKVMRKGMVVEGVGISYINLTDGRVHYQTAVPTGRWWTWEYGGALPYIGREPSFRFEANSIDMITLRDGSRALAFEGHYKNESKVDYDIWVMTLNSTMGWNLPNRVTIKSSLEKNPSITQLNSQDETLIVAFESDGGLPEEAIQISYSKDLGKSWSEPEPLSFTGMPTFGLYARIDPTSPSVAASRNEGFFYSFTSTMFSRVASFDPRGRLIWDWALYYGVFVGFNPSSNWVKYEIGNVHTLAVGDTDNDGLREIAANHKNKAILFEIKHTGASYQEHSQVWTSEELAEDVTQITIGDGNGNGWPEIIIAAERGNVYSYEITDTTLPKHKFYPLTANIDETPNIVSHWKFEEGSGTTVNDSTGSGNAGTLNGTSWVDGKSGKALRFDGVDDYVEVPLTPSLDIKGPHTLEAWIQFERIIPNNWHPLTPVQKYRYGLYYHPNAGLRAHHSTDLTTIDFVTWSCDLKGERWYHVVQTFDGTKLRAYINGVEMTNGATGFPPNVESENTGITIGRGWTSTGIHLFCGIIDEVAIYNRALTPLEIQQHYIIPNIISQWKFNEGSDGTAFDSVGTNNGTLINGPAWTTGILDGALSFDGVDDYVEVPDSNSLDITAAVFPQRWEITIEAWIKPDFIDSNRPIVTKGSGPFVNYALRIKDGKLEFYYSGPEASQDAPQWNSWTTTDVVFTSGKWHHVAVRCIFERESIQAFVNGKLQPGSWTAGSGWTPTKANDFPLQIATVTHSPTARDYFRGTIDELTIYNRALTAAEIKLHIVMAILMFLR